MRQQFCSCFILILFCQTERAIELPPQCTSVSLWGCVSVCASAATNPTVINSCRSMLNVCYRHMQVIARAIQSPSNAQQGQTQTGIQWNYEKCGGIAVSSTTIITVWWKCVELKIHTDPWRICPCGVVTRGKHWAVMLHFSSHGNFKHSLMSQAKAIKMDLHFPACMWSFFSINKSKKPLQFAICHAASYSWRCIA